MMARGMVRDAKEQLLRATTGKIPKRATSEYQQRLRQATRAPYPQPNPHAPDRLAPTVLHLPKEELREFVAVTLGRLRRTLRTEWMAALRFAHQTREIPPILDEELTRYLVGTLFCKSMTTELDERDQRNLAECGPTHGVVYKLDNSPASLIRTVEGTYSTGTICYFGRRAEGQDLQPIGIVLLDTEADEPVLLRPVDGDAWELAKHFALLSAENNGLVGTHALVHFPMNAINALTKAILPPKHKITKLLMPHLYNQLCLDYSVMFIRQSPLHNNQDEFFTGFTWTLESAIEVTQFCYAGEEGNPVYPGYTFSYEPHKFHTDYSDFIGGYRTIIEDFVREVMRGVEVDEQVARWANECARHVSGFPDADEMRQGDVLVKTIAAVICNNSVLHSTDHYTFGQIPIEKKSLRIRVPPPSSRDIAPLDRKAFMTAEDRFRMYLTHEMHITPSNETHLGNVDYGFDEPELIALNKRFLEQLHAYDADPGVTRHAPLEEIACSIQY